MARGFQLTGRSFLPVIREYNGESFSDLLEFQTYEMAFSQFKVREGGQLYIVGYGDTRIRNRDYDWYLYGWSDDTGRYEIVDEGLIDPSLVPAYDS